MSDPGRRHPAPFPAQLLQLFGVLLLRSFVRFCYRCDARFAVPLPPPPVLFAANHRSFLDPPLVGMWLKQPISYFARADLWRLPVIGPVLRIMRGIPVERENPGMSSMKGAVERLREGMSVLVFPEGTRTRTGRLGRLRDGPALFARRAGVPVVPVYLHRSEQGWKRGHPLPSPTALPIAVRFGRPIVPPAHLPPKEQDRWVTIRLEAWMKAMEARMYARHPR